MSDLLSVSVSRVLTVKASLLVAAAVRHPAVAVTVKTSNPALSAAIATGYSACRFKIDVERERKERERERERDREKRLYV